MPADVTAPRRERLPRWAIPALAIVIAGAALVFALIYVQTAARSDKLAGTAQQACSTGAVASSPDGTALCQQAAQVQANPVPGPIGPAGADGLPGKDGQPGKDGRDGRDGQSPPCLAEPGRCKGTDGQPGTNGTDGKDGAAGKDGADGRPGTDGKGGSAGKPPAGFTFTDPAGRAQTCTRDPASPDDAATYTCTTPATSTPTSLRITDLR